jgi:hypothetical protein
MLKDTKIQNQMLNADKNFVKIKTRDYSFYMYF